MVSAYRRQSVDMETVEHVKESSGRRGISFSVDAEPTSTKANKKTGPLRGSSHFHLKDLLAQGHSLNEIEEDEDFETIEKRVQEEVLLLLLILLRLPPLFSPSLSSFLPAGSSCPLVCCGWCSHN